MDAQTLHIDLSVPNGWHDINDKQLRFFYGLVAEGLPAEDIVVICLLRWSRTEVIGKQPNGAFLMRQGGNTFTVAAVAIAMLICYLQWLHEIPSIPVRLSKIGRKKALPADFQGVPFEKLIICDNLYQGYLHSQDGKLLDQLAAVLYDGNVRPDDAERISVFYWMSSLKAYLSKRFSDFFQPANAEDANLLGTPNIGSRLQESVDAQIRALTKGDITKEDEVLALDTWRALTELNAQAREYREIQKHTKR